MEGKFKPLGDRVLVRPESLGETKSKGGIILTDSAQRGQKVLGEVVEVGTGIFSQSGDVIPMTVKVGNQVMYSKDMTGDPITIDGEKYFLIREHELLGFYE